MMKYMMEVVEVSNKKHFHGLVGLLLATAFSVIVVRGQAFAGEGGNTGGGGIHGCSKSSGLWTCYGATWRYYTISASEPNPNRIHIAGYGDGTHGGDKHDTDYNQYKYAWHGYIEGCADYGGYWRYAMVRADGNHEQYGLIGIGGNDSHDFDSQMFWYDDLGWYGGMQYIPPTSGDGLNANNANWDDVREIYSKLQEFSPENFTKGWTSNSNLAWFCGPDNPDDVDPNKYEGLVSVSDDKVSWKSTDFQSSDYSVTQDIECDPVDGCVARFEHKLKRVSGTENLEYSIERTSNYSSVSSGAIKTNASESFNSNPAEVRSARDSTIRMYPGQVVCEKLKFKPHADAGQVTLTACASAVGKAQSDDEALLDIKVKNNDVPKYNNYISTVYAKPGDNLSYRTLYHPILQYAYNLKPQKIQINGGTVYPTSGINTDKTLEELFNANSGMENWKNGFSVYSDPSTFSLKNYNYEIGSTDLREEYENYMVRYNNVGYSLKGIAATNRSESTKTTPKQVEFVNDGGNNKAKVDTGQISSTATALAPYNYSTTINVDQVPEVAFAGETVGIRYTSEVKKKTNVETTNGAEDESYATIARGVKERLVYYIDNTGDGGRVGVNNWGNGSSDLCGYYGLVRGGNCDYMMDLNGLTLNGSGNLEGSTSTASRSVNVPDFSAGTRICVAAAIYPANSGADTNLSTSGNDKWMISDAKCFVIAKRPSFQVWGGGLQAIGNISATESVKNNLAGIFAYDLNSRNNSVVFGSFVEQNVVSSGLVNGLASGAATGKLLGDIHGIQYGSIEGNNVSYCNRRVPLSFANYSNLRTICPRTYGGVQYTGLSGINVSDDGLALVEYLLNEDNDSVATYSGVVNLNADYVTLSSEGGRNVNYTKGDGDLTIVGGGTAANVTQVVKTTGDVRINANMIYASGAYANFKQIPKLVIYANNIVIDCAVNRVDAILIANKNISTCDNEDVNARVNSNQLTINGAIMAGSLTLNRTYGAVAGANSGVPAEIINYDTSATLWGKNLTGSESGSGFVTVHQRELSPRY